jgi:hypothetical protein
MGEKATWTCHRDRRVSFLSRAIRDPYTHYDGVMMKPSDWMLPVILQSRGGIETCDIITRIKQTM